ncbi:tRNA-specific adenosine deaminase 1 [Linnemannia zychae]|nr:tRNA-specific adenosine deaminase 1 [Linnemannia zychae]
MRTSTTQELTSIIVQECHAQFDRLPKHGKPAKRSNGQTEWTILAGIVMATPIDKGLEDQQCKSNSYSTEGEIWEVECISLATGSKCLPQGKQSPRGDLLNDCHAEVLARRGFNRWCLQEMRKSLENPTNPHNKFRYLKDHPEVPSRMRPVFFELVNPKSQFHLYVSQAPCGDATTASLAEIQSQESKNAFMAGQTSQSKTAENARIMTDQDSTQSPVLGSKHAREPQDDQVDLASPPTKLQKQDSTPLHAINTNTTPIKIIHSLVDHALGFRRGRIDYESVGVLRTKPGRVDSEPTLSMSCSDKIARWNILGLCSGLVIPFLKAPIYLDSIITRELFDAHALKRALVERIRAEQRTDQTDQWDPFEQHQISVHKSEIVFDYSKEAVSKRNELEGITVPPVASASSISWIASEPQTTEVLINGCKAGASTKKQIQAKSRSRLCKINMLYTSVGLWNAISPVPDFLQSPLTPPASDTARESRPDLKWQATSYSTWKTLDIDYTLAKYQLFEGVFQRWVKGDRLLEFFDLYTDSISK